MTYWSKHTKSVGKKRKYIYCRDSKKVSVEMNIDLFKRLVNYVDDGPNLNSISHAINVAVKEYVDSLDAEVIKMDRWFENEGELKLQKLHYYNKEMERKCNHD